MNLKLRGGLLINIFMIFSTLLILEIISGYFYNYRRIQNSSLYYTFEKLIFKEKRVSKIDKINELKDKGYKNVFPSYLYDPQVHSLNKINYWFSHPPNSKIVLCKESSGWTIFDSNKLGFRYVLNQDLNDPLEIILIGDSFLEGACIDSPYDISSQISLMSNKNVLNLGFSGTGPLYQLALFREILNYSKKGGIYLDEDLDLTWIIFTGNDLQNLAEEKSSILSLYLTNKNFNLDYFINKEKDLANRISFLNNAVENSHDNKMIGGHGYGETIIPKSISLTNSLDDLEKIYYSFKETANLNKINLNILILTNHPAYNEELMNATEQRLKYLCKENASRCLFVDLKKIRSKNFIGHLYPNEYKKLAEIIYNSFLNK